MSQTISENIVDLSTAMENLEGDTELLQEIVEIFMDMGPDQLDSIENCIAADDINSVQIQSHGMKGGASNFGAVQFVKSALALEMLAKQGTLDGATELMTAMRSDFTELQQTLETIDWEQVSAQYEPV